jgi:hypothetical protein
MKHNIACRFAIMGAMSALTLSFLTVGCSHTVSHTERTRVSSTGSVKSTEETVRQNPDGTVTKTETKRTSNP